MHLMIRSIDSSLFFGANCCFIDKANKAMCTFPDQLLAQSSCKEVCTSVNDEDYSFTCD